MRSKLSLKTSGLLMVGSIFLGSASIAMENKASEYEPSVETESTTSLVIELRRTLKAYKLMQLERIFQGIHGKNNLRKPEKTQGNNLDSYLVHIRKKYLDKRMVEDAAFSLYLALKLHVQCDDFDDKELETALQYLWILYQMSTKVQSYIEEQKEDTIDLEKWTPYLEDLSDNS